VATYQELVAQAQACVDAGRPQDAEPALRAIVAANPGEHYAWALLGRAALFRGRPEEAEAHFQAALRGDRKSAQYLNLLGVALAEQGRADEALAALRRALRARPAFAEAHYNVGKVLYKVGNLRDARDAFRRAASIDARYPGARYYLAKTLTELGEPADALSLLEAAQADSPQDEWYPIQCARALLAMDREAEALAVMHAAAARMPESSMVRRSFATTLLGAGRYREGWREYRHRAIVGDQSRAVLPDPLPEDLSGRVIEVVWEQGFGDVLFFCRWLPLLRARGARAIVLVPPRLAPLLRRSGWADEVHEGDVASGGDWCFAGDLPFVLGSEVPALPLPLAPLTAEAAAWQTRLAASGPPPYLAVAWRAGADFRHGPEMGSNLQVLSKAVAPDVLGGALQSWPGTLVSVQREPGSGETAALASGAGRPTLDASESNATLESVLALLSLTQGYAGVSSTNVHLLAALGKPAVIAVPFPPEWRWASHGEASPWFPSMRLVRQRPGVDWRDNLAAMPGLLPT
jgi:tetratricopeptide (TPR) repeat protein